MVTAIFVGSRSDGVPHKSPAAGDDVPTWRLPAPPQALLPFPSDSVLDTDSRRLLELLEVYMDGVRSVPGLCRLLAHWPQYLAHVAVDIIPLFQCDGVVDLCSQVVSRVDLVVPPLADGLAAGPMPFDLETADALRGSLRVYRGLTSPQMIVFSAIPQEALPEASSI